VQEAELHKMLMEVKTLRAHVDRAMAAMEARLQSQLPAPTPTSRHDWKQWRKNLERDLKASGVQF